MYKIQVQDDENDVRSWHDVLGPDGKPLTFPSMEAGRERLQALFPVLVQMEQYAGPKRTRVINIIRDED